jgi:hypothetical protein
MMLITSGQRGVSYLEDLGKPALADELLDDVATSERAVVSEGGLALVQQATQRANVQTLLTAQPLLQRLQLRRLLRRIAKKTYRFKLAPFAEYKEEKRMGMVIRPIPF